MKNNSLTIAGFMSGTSMDGLDCCIAKININKKWDFSYEIIATKSYDFNISLKGDTMRSAHPDSAIDKLDLETEGQQTF